MNKEFAVKLQASLTCISIYNKRRKNLQNCNWYPLQRNNKAIKKDWYKCCQIITSSTMHNGRHILQP